MEIPVQGEPEKVGEDIHCKIAGGEQDKIMRSEDVFKNEDRVEHYHDDDMEIQRRFEARYFRDDFVRERAFQRRFSEPGFAGNSPSPSLAFFYADLDQGHRQGE